MNDYIEIKKRVEASFIASMANYLRLKERERNGIYVTDLAEKCMRKIFWDVTRPSTRNYDERDIISLGIGTLTHTLPLSDVHEVKLRYRNIVGRIDDVVNMNDYTVIIVDKKTCSTIPAEPKEQHVNQVRYYAVLLEFGEREEDGQWVQNEGKGQKYIGTVLYIDLNNGKVEAKVFPIDIGQAKMELDQKIDFITRAMLEGKVPESTYGWWCSYCPWYLECRLLDGQDLSKVQSIPV